MHSNSPSTINRLLLTLSAILIALAFFYGLNHLVMGMQGLPLNLDMTPIS